MFGFGVSMNQVFASRWKALLWAAGIMMTAYCAIPAPEEAQSPDPQQITQLPGIEDIPQIPPPEE